MISEQHRICSTDQDGAVMDSILVGVDTHAEPNYPVYLEIEDGSGDQAAIRLSIAEAIRFHDNLGNVIGIARENASSIRS